MVGYLGGSHPCRGEEDKGLGEGTLLAETRRGQRLECKINQSMNKWRKEVQRSQTKELKGEYTHTHAHMHTHTHTLLHTQYTHSQTHSHTHTHKTTPTHILITYTLTQTHKHSYSTHIPTLTHKDTLSQHIFSHLYKHTHTHLHRHTFTHTVRQSQVLYVVTFLRILEFWF